MSDWSVDQKRFCHGPCLMMFIFVCSMVCFVTSIDFVIALFISLISCLIVCCSVIFVCVVGVCVILHEFQCFCCNSRMCIDWCFVFRCICCDSYLCVLSEEWCVFSVLSADVIVGRFVSFLMLVFACFVKSLQFVFFVIGGVMWVVLSCFYLFFFSVSVSCRWSHPLFFCVKQEEIVDRRCFVDMK